MHFGASCDKVEQNTKFAKELKLDYPLLSDPDKKVAKAYGILQFGYSKRVTFIIDQDGKIAAIENKVNVSSHGADLVKKLSALKMKPAKR